MGDFVHFWRFFDYRIHILRAYWLYITENMYFVPTNHIMKVPPKKLKFDQFMAQYMSKSALAPIFGRIRFGPQLGHFKSDLDKQKK